RRVLRGGTFVAERYVEHRLGFRIHVASEVEPRKLEARRGTLGFRRGSGGVEELDLTVDEIGFLVEAPQLRVEHERTIAAVTLADRAARRHDEPARSAEHHLVGGELDREVVGERL